MQVEWQKCKGDTWCSLNRVILDDRHEIGGVYIIWHGGDRPAVVYIGQTSNIKQRLEQHRENYSVQKYQPFGLYVTWTYEKDADIRRRIEAYLWSIYSVKEGYRQTHDYPIEVTTPF